MASFSCSTFSSSCRAFSCSSKLGSGLVGAGCFVAGVVDLPAAFLSVAVADLDAGAGAFLSAAVAGCAAAVFYAFLASSTGLEAVVAGFADVAAVLGAGLLDIFP